MLYLVGTPIGNMGDLSPRAREILSSVSYIACEDTRRTGLLLKNAGIPSPGLISYYEQNKRAKGEYLLRLLREGNDIALVSDAGMPSISDPGEDIVRLCIEENVEFTVVPGPVAAITALVLSGLSTRTYHYEGFLPSEGKERKERLDAISKIRETLVIYEAPHRLTKLIKELLEYGFGNSKAAFCREMTKKYEQVLRMTVSEASSYYEQNAPKGEFVICLEPSENAFEKGAGMTDDEITAAAMKLHDEGMPTKQIAASLAEMTGRNKKEMYSLVINLLN